MPDTRDNFDEELFKQLVEENSKYIEKVHQTWNQKLMMVGAMVAFLVVNQNAIVDGDTVPLNIVVLAVPIMCIMLDAHMLEKALHARIISHFIIERFEKTGGASPWFTTFWGLHSERKLKSPLYYLACFWLPQKEGHSIESLVGMRSATTTLVSIVPTVLVLFMAAYSLPEYQVLAYGCACIVSVLYVLSAAVIFSSMRKRVVSGLEDDKQAAGATSSV